MEGGITQQLELFVMLAYIMLTCCISRYIALLYISVV